MTKDVLVSISGMHMQVLPELTEEENETIETVTPATYYYKNGKHYILYDEVTEGETKVTKNKIKISDDGSIEVIKKGVSNTHMIFKHNEKNLTYYQTPFGQLLVGANTKKLDINTEEEKIEVYIEYELEVNHEPMAECEIKIGIYSKGTASVFEM